MLFSAQSLKRLALILFIPIPFLVLALFLGVMWRSGALFNLTGEERFAAGVKGLTDLTADWMRPGLELGGKEPAAHSGVNPFGVNVFLEQEPSPEVREAVVKIPRTEDIPSRLLLIIVAIIYPPRLVNSLLQQAQR